jgi:O-antigen ligase
MLKVARIAFLLLVFSLPFVKPRIPISPFSPMLTDLLTVGTAAALLMAILLRETRLRWHPLFTVVLIFLGAMVISAAVNGTWSRLPVEALPLILPVLALSLIDTEKDLRTTLLTWLGATAISAAVGTLSVLIFYTVAHPQPPWNFGLHPFGTLAPGNYTRIEGTFEFPATLCNYLTVSLMILLAARYLRWIGQGVFFIILGLLLFSAAFTVTPGLGGIFLALGLWLFLSRNRAWLALGSAAAVAFVGIAAVTPIIHPTAPFVFRLPGLVLAPAVRMMTWMGSWHTFLAHPLFGVGIGGEATGVRYVNPSGWVQWVTDAHNTYLNFAAQCGIIGLAAMVLLIVWVARRTLPLRLDHHNALRLALGLAWLNAFAYQGLYGSFEDQRHLWLLLGLFAVAAKLELAEEATEEASR